MTANGKAARKGCPDRYLTAVGLFGGGRVPVRCCVVEAPEPNEAPWWERDLGLGRGREPGMAFAAAGLGS